MAHNQITSFRVEYQEAATGCPLVNGTKKYHSFLADNTVGCCYLSAARGQQISWMGIRMNNGILFALNKQQLLVDGCSSLLGMNVQKSRMRGRMEWSLVRTLKLKLRNEPVKFFVLIIKSNGRGGGNVIQFEISKNSKKCWLEKTLICV